MTLNELARQIALDFKQTCNREPQWIVAAPGRVNVIGEHTDYNDGFVLPMAIDRYTLIAAAPNGTTQITLRSSAGQGQARVDLTSPLQPGTKGDWANYPLGVIAGFLARGLRPPGFDALIHSTVPLGGGLSSSAALEVATATLLEVITGQKLDPVEKALLCQKAEHDYAGVPCGIMDQFISVMGKENHLLLLDCRSRRPELVPMSDSSVALLIVNTNVKHELTGGGYAQRRAQCEQAAQILGVPSLRDASEDLLQAARSRMDDVVFRRARHVIGEIQRTVQAAAEVRASNWPVVGQLMYASHASLRDDYEVSCAELDVVVDIGRAIGPAGGVMGCRMTGGGFGGCAVALVRADQMAAISQRLAAEYEQRTNIKPTLFVSRPAAGAMVLKP
ncbi:MAG TPA: galactokinase [Verrucomicrobiota bacterium]|jgi:galactokinase|nr:galactokinase [Verrucomicrobiota bacterium]HCL91961.1 galactokinase [Limisphaerales bacterium]HRR63410.1 galactokinase [Candidatus Paceibacterota bacterium]MDI9373630.1 galactokinase [Verrucomicrobiota bacterium]NLH85588.1 galactokinase [Verrucomicrobiota bacterium]